MVLDSEKLKSLINNNVMYNQEIVGFNDDRFYRKENILLDSNSAHHITSILDEMDVAYANINVNRVNPRRYMGENINDLLVKLLENAGGDLRKAEAGVIVLDEINSLLLKDINKYPSLSKEEKETIERVNNYKSLQNSEINLLLSGEMIPVIYHDVEFVFDTSKLSLICVGQFKNQEDINELLNNYLTNLVYVGSYYKELSNVQKNVIKR